MRKVLILGARGYLAHAYAQHWAGLHRVVCSTIDVTDRIALRHVLEDERPHVVLNTAGVTHGTTSPNIDGCEESVAACQRTVTVNAFAAGLIAAATHAAHIRLIHLSSGCIFNGDGPFSETDRPNPVSWYARTKVAGEHAVQAADPEALILRLRMPIDGTLHSRNLLSKLAGYTAVVDAPNSLTSVDALLQATDTLVAVRATGIVHVVNPGPVSPYAIACQMADAEDRPRPRRLTPAQLDSLTTAPRSNCVLRTARLDAYGIRLQDAQDAVTQAIAARVALRVEINATSTREAACRA